MIIITTEKAIHHKFKWIIIDRIDVPNPDFFLVVQVLFLNKEEQIASRQHKTIKRYEPKIEKEEKSLFTR